MNAGAPVPGDFDWDRAVRDRLRDLVPRVVAGAPAVGAVARVTDVVWRVHLADSGRLIAKHQFYGLLTRGQPHDLLAVEHDALRQLRAAGAPVPVCLGIDADAQLILLEDAGPRTLADVLAAAPPADERRRLGRRVLAGLARIDAVLDSPAAGWAERVVPGAGRHDLAAAWAPVAGAAVDGLRRLWQAARGSGPPKALESTVLELGRRLGERPPRLGVTDYHPGNIVVDGSGERLAFLELAKVGWDWTERRAVQYTTTVDGGGLLDPEVVRPPAHGVDGDALDGHHLLFLLLLAGRLPDGSVAGDFLRALTTPLGRDPAAIDLRRHLRRLVAPDHPSTERTP